MQSAESLVGSTCCRSTVVSRCLHCASASPLFGAGLASMSTPGKFLMSTSAGQSFLAFVKRRSCCGLGCTDHTGVEGKRQCLTGHHSLLLQHYRTWCSRQCRTCRTSKTQMSRHFADITSACNLLVWLCRVKIRMCASFAPSHPLHMRRLHQLSCK